MPDQNVPLHPTVVVRTGTVADVDGVMKLALLGSAENGYTKPSAEKMLRDIYPALALDHGIMGVIGPPGGELEGAVLLRISWPWYTEEQTLEERGIFVHPDHRDAKGGRFARLVEFSKTTALRLELPLSIGVLSNHRTEAKVRTYRRLLGDPAGAFFLFNARTGGAVEGDTTDG